MAAAVVILGVAIFAGRDEIRERWYLHRMDSPDLDVRKHAIEKLGDLGSRKASPRVLSGLEKALWSDDDATSRAALDALLRMKIRTEDLAPILIQAMGRPSSTMSTHLILPLIEMGATAVPYLRNALDSKEPRVRAGALMIIRYRMTSPEEQYRVLDRFLGDPDEEVRVAALLAAHGWENLEGKAVPHILRALSDTNETARNIAVRVAKRMKEHADLLVPALLPILDEETSAADDVWAARAQVPGALASLAGDSPPIRKRIREALEDRNPWVRMDAISALTKLGEKEPVYVESLRRILEEDGPAAAHRDYERARGYAASRLIALGHATLVLGSLDSHDRRIRATVARELRTARPPVPGAREALEALLADEKDADVAREARAALDALPPVTPTSPPPPRPGILPP